MRRIPRVSLLAVGIIALLILAGLSLQAPGALAEPLSQEEIPHALAGREDCLLCHKAGGVEPAPANHSTYNNTMCTTCHKVAGAQPPAQATQPVVQPTAAAAQPTQAAAQSGPKAIPHAVAGKENCLLCHAAGGMKPVPANHSSYAVTTCTTCHKEAAAQQPAAQPTQPAAQPTAAAQPTQAAVQTGPKAIPHAVAGKENCLLCHAAGGMKPVPASHSSYAVTTCTSCHKESVTQPAAQPTAAAVQPTRPAAAATQAPAPAQPSSTRPPSAPGAPNIIPHTLEGRAACTTCHGAAGMKPYPSDHAGRPDSGCLQCHVPVSSPRAPTPGAGTQLPPGNETCLACHKQTDMHTTLASGDRLNLYVDGEKYAQSVHGQQGLQCTTCHPAMTQFPHPPIAATTQRELNRSVVEKACATCHKDVHDKFKESVHGKALIEENNGDVPSCTDCHGVHSIKDPKTSLFRLDSPDLCSSCHADAEKMAKYGISPDVTKTYLGDFHGSTVRLTKQQDPSGTTYKAVCYDCHGIHDIKKTDDPNSSVVKANLLVTCQKCHPDADANFPTAWTSHYVPDRTKWPLVYLVDLFYKIVIPVVIGGITLYIILDIGRTIINKRRAGRAK